MKVYCRRVVYSNRQSPKGVILDKKKRKINLEANFPVGTGFTVSMVPSVKYEEMVEGGSRPNLRQCLRRPRIHTRWTLSFLRDMFLKLADQRRISRRISVAYVKKTIQRKVKKLINRQLIVNAIMTKTKRYEKRDH